jgi:hypothetical protein
MPIDDDQALLPRRFMKVGPGDRSHVGGVADDRTSSRC